MEKALDNTSSSPKPMERIMSVDALRGFDMFWIVGADELFGALGKISHSPIAGFFARQLHHVPWEGFVFYDLIFPLFVFLVGMGIVFSMDKLIEREGMRGAHVRIFRRFLLLFLLGAFRDMGIADMAHGSPFSGVLQRIAWCYLFTSLLYIHGKRKGLVVALLVILIGYWALLTFVPAPGTDAASYGKNENIVNWFDHKFLPFKEEGQYSDPEGLLSTIPAIASCILGVFAGWLILNKEMPHDRKVMYLLAAGAVLTVAGYLWGLQFPVIKRLWTSSYVLVAGGYSAMLLGLFYLVVDIWKYRLWARPFIWIGANPLIIYMAGEFVRFRSMGERVAGGPVAALFGDYGELLVVAVSIVFVLLFARFLYNRKLFLRV